MSSVDQMAHAASHGGKELVSELGPGSIGQLVDAGAESSLGIGRDLSSSPVGE
jgi:hypothetical protein